MIKFYLAQIADCNILIERKKSVSVHKQIYTLHTPTRARTHTHRTSHIAHRHTYIIYLQKISYDNQIDAANAFLLLLLQNNTSEIEEREKGMESEIEKEKTKKKHIVIKYKSDLLMNLLICANKIYK